MGENPEDPQQQIDNGMVGRLLDEEAGLRQAADRLEQAVLSSLAAQIKWWRRFAIIAFVVLAFISAGTIYNRMTLNEIRKTQIDVEVLVDYVGLLRQSTDVGADRLSRIDDALTNIEEIREVLCRIDDQFCEVEE